MVSRMTNVITVYQPHASLIMAGIKTWETRGNPPSRVTVTLPVSGNRKRDPHNWTPTVKAIVDGLVDAGVWPDDNSDWVTTNEPVLDTTATQVAVRITPLSKEEA